MSWIAYFDALESSSPVYAEQAALYVNALLEAVKLGSDDEVLDFGCGFGFVAERIAPLVARLWLWDASANMRAAAERRTRRFANVRMCTLVDDPADATHATEPRAVDLVLVNSVVQYMSQDEIARWLSRWRAMLTPGGRIVLSDLIPPRHGTLTDIGDLLRLGIRIGSPLAATREAFGSVGRYWRIRHAAPLTRIDPEDLQRRAAAVRLVSERLPRNLTHFRARWSAVLRADR